MGAGFIYLAVYKQNTSHLERVKVSVKSSFRFIQILHIVIYNIRKSYENVYEVSDSQVYVFEFKCNSQPICPMF
jgi:hypothetical protein